ncbi:MAG: hypothetical protein K2I64_00595 [Muribaculaceae bacterium]|nr:hypothetical protein [Muribaculaceae bacterium]
MRYIILLYLGLCSCITNGSESEIHNTTQNDFQSMREYLYNDLGTKSSEQIALTDSQKIAIYQELLNSDTIEFTRLKDLLTIQNDIELQYHTSILDNIEHSPIDSCKILLTNEYDLPSFKVALTKELSLIGISSGRNLFSFDQKFPIFTLKYEVSANLFKCIDNIYLRKETPKILKKENGRVKSSEMTEIKIEYFYGNRSGSDRYIQDRGYYMLLPKYTYGVDAQYIISAVNQIYYEYCRNIGLPTQNLLGSMMWYLK